MRRETTVAFDLQNFSVDVGGHVFPREENSRFPCDMIWRPNMA
jgi:hypothetical protein